MQFFHQKSWSVNVYWNLLIDDADSKNLVQMVVKFFMEIDPKFFNQQ